MASKEEILRKLEECQKTEETAIPIYSKHIGDTLFLSGFKPADRKRLSKTLAILHKDSIRHQEIFESIIDKVKGSPQNVY